MDQRRSRQHYPLEQKAGSCQLFHELQNDTAAARQPGMNPAVTCNLLRERGLCSRGKTGSSQRPCTEHYLTDSGSEPASAERLAQPLHSRLLSLEEREHIGDLRRAGCSLRQIAGALGWAPSWNATPATCYSSTSPKGGT